MMITWAQKVWSRNYIIEACVAVQGIKQISVQSSVSLQHLPYDVALESGLPKDIEAKLSFATQKLKEIVKAKNPSTRAGSLTDALPAVGEKHFQTLFSGCRYWCPCLSTSFKTRVSHNSATASFLPRMVIGWN
jgi:hypothetical protein